jgi:hypothetical protein
VTGPKGEPLRHAPGMPQAGDAAVPTADAGEASNHLGQDDRADVDRAGRPGGPGTQKARPSDRQRGGPGKRSET